MEKIRKFALVEPWNDVQRRLTHVWIIPFTKKDKSDFVFGEAYCISFNKQAEAVAFAWGYNTAAEQKD